MVEEYGLIGRGIGHSFSANYFNDKFEKESIDASYSLFDLHNIEEIKKIFEEHPNLRGLNVTSPYKRDVIRYVDSLSPAAKELNAVNVVSVLRSPLGELFLKGDNSDYEGFRLTLKDLFSDKEDVKAMIMGTGGASTAVALALRMENIPYKIVSRNPKEDEIGYEEMNEMLKDYQLIINATPLGMYPDVDKAPDIDFSRLTEKHICYDLIYNPSETTFLKKAKKRKSRTINGLDMLLNQAELSWKIWKENGV